MHHHSLDRATVEPDRNPPRNLDSSRTLGHFQKAHLVIGPHGVTGSAIADRLGARTEWELSTASRRSGVHRLSNGRAGAQHVSVDLLDAAASRAAFANLGFVTHLVYAAYLERLTMAEATGPNVAMLENALDALRAAGAPLQRVVLIGGGKSYGEHLGPYKTPAKETDSRYLGPIFYNDQEDLLAVRARTAGFTGRCCGPMWSSGSAPVRR